MTTTSNIINTKELSPCVRNCCLDGNDVCVGCYRHLSEIVGWRDKSESQKKAILVCCEQRKNKPLIS
jgi:predicted Fe-S protein YdhL (DUF1289 family)